LLRKAGQAMNWGHLVFQFDGRVSRSRFWIAALIFAAINVVLAILGYVTDQSVVFQALNSMLGIVILISSIAVGVKRLHDRNKSGWYLLLFYLVPSILVVIGVLIGAFVEDSTIIATVLGLLAFAIGVWAFVEMGCLRGTVGVNRYGPDPIAPATIPPVRLRT
jgi:uncharacterized membrane protein YhaH (DUF805 family)